MEEIRLIPAFPEDADLFYSLMREAFLPLYLRYQDHETSPANEPLEKTVRRLSAPDSHCFFISADGQTVGGIRIVDGSDGERRISPLFVAPRFQNRGIAGRVLAMCFEKFSDTVLWRLTTIKQEPGNCWLYRKMGFRQTPGETVINEKMTLIDFERRREDV